MKLTSQIAANLRKQGAKIDSKQVIRNKPVEKVPIETQGVHVITQKPDEDSKQILQQLTCIAQQSAVSIERLTTALVEISMPKPKKSWECSIGRNDRGEMTTIDINEI